MSDLEQMLRELEARKAEFRAACAADKPLPGEAEFARLENAWLCADEEFRNALTWATGLPAASIVAALS